MKNPLISVVLTSYNQLNSLKRSLNSLLDQSYSNFEIIVVDDFSSDGSQDYILNMAGLYDNIRYFFQPKNVGIPINKNTGFRLSTGKFITYLDGDDFYYPDKIKEEVRYLENHLDVDVVYSNFNFTDKNGKQIRHWRDDQKIPKQGDLFMKIVTRDFPYNTLFRCETIKKSVLHSINYYDESVKAFHDWDSRIRYSAFAKIGFCDNIGSAYVDDPSGISKSLLRADLIREMKYVVNKNSNLIYKTLDMELGGKVIKEMNYKFNDQLIRLLESSPKEQLYAAISFLFKSFERTNFIYFRHALKNFFNA